MNSKIVSSKITSAIFLAIVLVAGTIAAISSLSSSPSFMINAQAQPYHGVDNSYEKSKDISSKSISVNKVKCINDNININGVNSGDVNVGNKGQVATSNAEGNLDAYSSDSSEGYYYDDDYKKLFDCIINNNNNNTNIVTGGAGNVTDGNGNVTDTCDTDVRACFDARLNDTQLQDIEDLFPFTTTILLDPQPPLTITIQSLDDFCEAFEGITDLRILEPILRDVLFEAGIPPGIIIELDDFRALV